MYFITPNFFSKLNPTEIPLWYDPEAIEAAIDWVAIAINATVLIMILMKANPPCSNRVVTFLIAHFACVCDLNVLISWFNTGDIFGPIPVPGRFSGSVNFLKNVMQATYFASMLVITYERIQSLSEENNSSSRKTAPSIFIIWSVSNLFSLPTAAMKTGVENSLAGTTNHNTSNDEWLLLTCKSVKLFGSWEATVIYEWLTFLVLHVGTGLYLLYGSIKIRSKLQYLVSHSNISSKELKHHMRYNRIIYFYLLSFCTIQLPSGIFLFCRKFNSNLINNNVLEALDMYLFPALAFYMHQIPLVSFLFLVGLKFPCEMCFCQQRQPSAIASEQEDGSNMAGYAECQDQATSSRIFRNVDSEEIMSSSEVHLNVQASTFETTV